MAFGSLISSTDVTNWDFNNFHVQRELSGGEFVAAESTLIAAGPPSLSMLTEYTDDGGIEVGDSGFVYPIGLIEQFSLNQALQVQPLYEIGSTRKYSIPGKVIGNVSLGRVMFSGPSILKVMYAYYKQDNASAPFQFMNETAMLLPSGQPNPNQMLLDLPAVQSELVQIKQNPGYGDLWLNLASDIFKQPTGLLVYFRNSLGQDVGAIYLENVQLSSHNFSLSAGANVIIESTSMEFDKVRPVDVTLASYVGANDPA